MSRIAPIYSDRVRYSLSHNPTGTQIIQEPQGWRDDDNEFVRHKTFHGIMTQMTNNLTFYNDGADFIEGIYKQYGINADLRMTKDERNPHTDIWERSYDGVLDLLTYSKEREGISCKFTSSSLLKLIKSRENEKIELDRLDTLSGEVIPYINTREVALNGRKIVLLSKLVTDPEFSVGGIYISNNGNNTRYGTIGLPVAEEFASNIGVIAVPPDANKISTSPVESADVQQLFFADNKNDTFMNLDIKGSMSILVHRDGFFTSNAVAEVRLVKYTDSTDYLFGEVLFSQAIGNLDNKSELNIGIDYQDSFNLLEGESLGFQIYTSAKMGTIIGQLGWFQLTLTNIDFTINVDEQSFFEPTTSKVVLPFEVCERYLKLITNQDNLLISNILGRTDTVPSYDDDGEASLIGMSHGFWVRGFSKDDIAEINEENRYKSMTSTFKDFYSSYFSVWNLGAGIEKVGFEEKLRVEELSYFYNRNVLLRLGKEVNGKFEYIQVSNVKRTLDNDMFSSGLDLGYTKGGDYEEAIGLDEYNTRTTFTTIIDKLDQQYMETSKYRADSYGMEFCRRFPKEKYPTEDTKYDNSIWLVDMKRGGTQTLHQRLWADDFEIEPTGVFDPSSAQNLRLSPFNILLRHGWVIGSGLTKYPSDFIRYGSSIANSGLTTQLIGGVPYAENGNIQNSKLEKARFDGELIEFEFEVDYELLQKVRGKTVILGKEIPNFYGLVAFKNEDGNIEKGYLKSLSPNGAGKWTLIRYNN